MNIPVVVNPYMPDNKAYLVSHNYNGSIRDIVAINFCAAQRPAPWFEPVVPDAPKEAKPAAGGDAKPRGTEELSLEELKERVEELEREVADLKSRPVIVPISIPAVPAEPVYPYVPYEPAPWVPGIDDGTGDSVTITWTDSSTSGKISGLIDSSFGGNDNKFGLYGG